MMREVFVIRPVNILNRHLATPKKIEPSKNEFVSTNKTEKYLFVCQLTFHSMSPLLRLFQSYQF